MIGWGRVFSATHGIKWPRIRLLTFREHMASLVNRLGWRYISRSLFRKYVALILGIMCVGFISGDIVEISLTYLNHKNLLIRIQNEQAGATATKISLFIKEIERQIGWTVQLPWPAGTFEERRFDGMRLLRQVPAIMELTLLDPNGREQLRLSRLASDVVGSQVDFSKDIKFTEAIAHKIYYSQVYFLDESEPYMSIAMAGSRRENGVTIAEINLKLIWDVISQIKVGEHGYAYIVDSQGRLIAHPDLSLVLSYTDLSQLLQVKAAISEEARLSPQTAQDGHDAQGRPVLTAHASIASLGWLVFVELPHDEAFAAIYYSVLHSGTLLLAGLILAVLAGLLLGRRLVTPIQALRDGAARIGSGDFDQRILIKTGDELQALADQFNSMAAQLQESYVNLEHKIKAEERTRQLELINLAKSRFIAAASHDLRQPLHALGLFVAQLRARLNSAGQKRIIEQIHIAVAEMNELFNELLDISKLDAGVLVPNLMEFPIAHLLQRIETTFAVIAREKGLRLRVVASAAWVRSDTVLLERILLNLVSNAVRYTSQGGVIVGCRWRGEMLCIEVWDSGAGIPENQQQNIFEEFYQLDGSQEGRHGGLGLGLAIVDRLRRLLDHPLKLTSILGKGSRFTVTVPLVAAQAKNVEPLRPDQAIIDMVRGKFVVVIDDDTLVQEGMGGLLRSWGCHVMTVSSHGEALADLPAQNQRPDLIIADYHLSGGKTGIEAIEHLRSAFDRPIPAFLITGDTNPERLLQIRTSGYQLLHKPADPMALRSMLNHLLKNNDNTIDAVTPITSAAL